MAKISNKLRFERIEFAKQNIHESNYFFASKFNISINGAKLFLRRNGLKRSEKILRDLHAKNGKRLGLQMSSEKRFAGEGNPNWKNGISKNNYHYKKIQRARYPERINARAKVKSAVKSGRLIKQPCVKCGDLNVHGHHEDYSKPLEVVWMCRKHHREEHGGKH